MKSRASQTSKTGSTCTAETPAGSARTSTASRYAQVQGNMRPTTLSAPDHAPTPARLTYEQIAERARTLWLASGCLPGRDVQNWCEAEAQLRAEMGSA